MRIEMVLDGHTHILTLLLTGGIGSGKSLVAGYLNEMGVPVYDFDSKTKELYDSDLELCLKVAEAVRPFTEEEVLTSDGHIDRHALARAVFGNFDTLDAVEAVVHPVVLADFKAWRSAYEQSFAQTLAAGTHKVVFGCLYSEKRGVQNLMLPIVAAESAIALSMPLFADEFDKVILITAPADVRRSRVIARDGLSKAEVNARMRIQNEADKDKVDYVIDNEGEKAALSLKLRNTVMDILRLMVE